MLQDKLPPFPMAEARAAIEHELGQPLDAVFADFEPPVAAASLAQVHRATLRDTGQAVAVKVLRPGIERAFLRDVDAFYFAAGMVELLAPVRPPAAPEGGDPRISRAWCWASSTCAWRPPPRPSSPPTPRATRGFRVPAVIWPASGRRVLTLEWATGINLGDLRGAARPAAPT